MSDRIKKLETVADAANALLTDIETVRTQAEAKLALALYALDPSLIHGKERCTCDDPQGCDECSTVAGNLSSLRALAAAHSLGGR